MQSYEHRPWLLQSPPVSEPAVVPRGRHVKKLRLGEAKGLLQGHGNPERSKSGRFQAGVSREGFGGVGEGEWRWAAEQSLGWRGRKPRLREPKETGAGSRRVLGTWACHGGRGHGRARIELCCSLEHLPEFV